MKVGDVIRASINTNNEQLSDFIELISIYEDTKETLFSCCREI